MGAGRRELRDELSVRAIGIYREREFSPGKVAADAAILDAALDELRAAGFDTRATSPGALADAGRADVVLAMCQSEGALEKLVSMEHSGPLVINSPRAIRNCYRDRLGDILTRAGVPTPRGMLVSTSRVPDRGLLGAVDISAVMYVKRGDLHALSPQDVVRVEGIAQLRRILERFRHRGVGLAYLQQAVQGTVVKFYGVGGGEFFRALSERDELSGAVSERLRAAASHAASALGLQAWGGDAVIAGDGRFWIIDFNDWPSYSRVLDEAASAIARRAIALLRDRESMWRVDASGEKA